VILDNFLSMLIGVTVVTREKVEDMTDLLVEKGKMQREDARKLAEEMVQKGKQEKEEYTRKVNQMVESMKGKIVTREDISRLEEKIDEILEHCQKEQ